MLSFLRIKDFALIRSLELELKKGLTVFSGETGTGKSIILAAVELLLGQRASTGLIRQGAESAVVEALFHIDSQSPRAESLIEDGLDLADLDGELAVRRIVSLEGRNRVQVAGALSTLAVLSRLGPNLINLCGQYAHQELLKSEGHLLMLDAFAGLEDMRRIVGISVAGLRRLDQEIQRIKRDLERREERREYLALVREELEAARLDPEEESVLKNESRRLANLEKVARLGEGALQGLYEAEEGSAQAVLGQVKNQLADLKSLDTGVADLAAKVDEAYYMVQESASDLRAYLDHLVFDPGRLDWVEARLMDIQRITRKYGGDVASAQEALEDARQELSQLEHGEEELEKLENKRGQALKEALSQAEKLSKTRQEAAAKLTKAVEAQLKELGMPACRLQVAFTPPAAGIQTGRGALCAQGLEQAEFFIAPNPGEGFRPLSRIASGGELSRILLALQSLVATHRGSSTQIYDEVDAGIGGATGWSVGRKLDRLAGKNQVLCITHLPQIAAWADRHFSVRKRAEKGRTITEVVPLDEEGRIAELARMLAGSEGGATAVTHAEKLLADARAQKKGRSSD